MEFSPGALIVLLMVGAAILAGLAFLVALTWETASLILDRRALRRAKESADARSRKKEPLPWYE